MYTKQLFYGRFISLPKYKLFTMLEIFCNRNTLIHISFLWCQEFNPGPHITQGNATPVSLMPSHKTHLLTVSEKNVKTLKVISYLSYIFLSLFMFNFSYLSAVMVNF